MQIFSVKVYMNKIEHKTKSLGAPLKIIYDIYDGHDAHDR